jgi:hypothetical protein
MASLQKASLTIAAAGQNSGELTDDQLRNARSMTIIAPATLTGTVTVQCGDIKPGEVVAGVPGTANFVDVQSPPGTDVIVTAGKATVLTVAPFPRLRLHSTLAEAAQRDFIVWFNVGE